MLGVGAAFLLEFMDKSVRDDRFITEELGWTSLGNVSEMSESELASKVEPVKQQNNTRRAHSRV